MEKEFSNFENANYGLEWYKSRAFSSLRKISDQVWDFSDSLLLYIPGAEGEYEEVQKTDNPYHELVTKPERKYLADIAAEVVDELPSEFEYIDLGPGTEHKEQFIFDAARVQGKKFSYSPVDINTKFLELAEKYSLDQGISTRPIRSSFEELAAKLPPSGKSRFVSLGLTYSNYDPSEILKLLKSISGESGFAFINSQLRDRADLPALVKIYSGNVFAIAQPKLELLGLDFNKDISEKVVDDGIRAWCVLKNSTPELAQIGIEPGSKLLVFQSLRPTKQDLESAVRGVFPSNKVFDMGEQFEGILLKPDKI